MKSNKKYREVRVYGKHFEVFFISQTEKVRDKIIWTLELIEDFKVVPTKFLKYVRNEIYEVRVRHGSNSFRILCFFDEHKLIVLLNAFQKKTNKVSKNEFKRAILLRKKYLLNKVN